MTVVGGVTFVVCASGLALLVLIPVFGRRDSRALPPSVCKELEAIPERRRNQQVADLELKDGRRIRKVWIAWGRYPAVLGGRTITQRYKIRDVTHAHAHAREAGG